MKTEYRQIDSDLRGYQGISFTDEECKQYLRGYVKVNLLDREQRESLLDSMKALKGETGFEPEELMIDIQALKNDDVNVPEWRIGEAFAEVVLNDNFQCRFHWNELRDARNLKANKTGADLVGFIEVDEQVLFLFGEVKTSSENNRRPPQVMTSQDGIESQLKDLYSDRNKRLNLISYLQNKVRLLSENHQFKEDFDKALSNYYQRYQLIGILVRDVELDERDVSVSYNRLKEFIIEPAGIRLIAVYASLPKREWLDIINSED